ncbi:hypothetical protein LEQ06_11735 [Paraclostridium sp. AKS46]|nr:hypothetical protein [Paraclostridium sp. AKS46]
MSKSEKDSIDSIYKNMDKDVKTVDAYDNLKNIKMSIYTLTLIITGLH